MTNWTATRAPPGHLGSAARRQDITRLASLVGRAGCRQGGASRYPEERGHNRRGRARTRVAWACRPEREASLRCFIKGRRMLMRGHRAHHAPRWLAGRLVGLRIMLRNGRTLCQRASPSACKDTQLLALTCGDDMLAATYRPRLFPSFPLLYYVSFGAKYVQNTIKTKPKKTRHV